MGKRREARERRQDEAQAEGAQLEWARRAAAALGVALPPALPSKYTRKGAAVWRQVAALTQVSEEVLAQEARRRSEEARRLAEVQAEARRRQETEQELRLRTEPTAPEPPGMVVRFQSTTAPPRPRGRSGARLALAMMAMGLGLGLPLPPDREG